MIDLFDKYTADTSIPAVEYDCGEEGLGLFETYGKDLDTVRAIAATSPRKVWTLVDTDFGGTQWVNGYCLFNRILYAVTMEEGQEGEIFQVLENDDNE